MNRPKSTLAALLLTGVIAVPAAAQQQSLAQTDAMTEFCAGCFAYLEFPPLPEEATRSSLASTHQGTTATTRAGPIVALMPHLVAPVKQ